MMQTNKSVFWRKGTKRNCPNFIYKRIFYDLLISFFLRFSSHLNFVNMPNRYSHRQSHRHSHRQPHRHSHRQPHRQPRRHSRPIQWFDEYTDYLVEERRRRNDEFHNEYGRDRSRFWRSIARRFICIIFNMLKYVKNRIIIFNPTNSFVWIRLNRHFRTLRFTAQRCHQKWRNLLREYHVWKI